MSSWGLRSKVRMRGLHPDLLKVLNRAAIICPPELDLTVLEGLRTKARQAQLLRAHATTTMNSRHLNGHAVDVGVLVNGKMRWDWPLYARLAKIMKQAAKDVEIPLEWGGDWKKFKDGPHFQLPWTVYPRA